MNLDSSFINSDRIPKPNGLRILMAGSRLLFLMVHEHTCDHCAGSNPAERREFRICDDIEDADNRQ